VISSSVGQNIFVFILILWLLFLNFNLCIHYLSSCRSLEVSSLFNTHLMSTGSSIFIIKLFLDHSSHLFVNLLSLPRLLIFTGVFVVLFFATELRNLHFTLIISKCWSSEASKRILWILLIITNLWILLSTSTLDLRHFKVAIHYRLVLYISFLLLIIARITAHVRRYSKIAVHHWILSSLLVLLLLNLSSANLRFRFLNSSRCSL